jgi:putative ABC transport system permease protein
LSLGRDLFLALLGAAIGATSARVEFRGNLQAMGTNVFHLQGMPGLLLLALVWTCAIALVGGLFPAVRAARLPVTLALRAK